MLRCKSRFEIHCNYKKRLSDKKGNVKMKHNKVFCIQVVIEQCRPEY